LREPQSLARALARCAVAVVGGGVTVAEACALATPAVAVSVAPAQRRTIQTFARAGAVVDGGRVDAPQAARRVAATVAHLLNDARDVRQMTERARRLVDGLGASRVAAALTDLIAEDGRSRHAA
jgi:spore coat polysaccharide biosynthesis predicted glycosyltransferase SpsG